MHDKGNQENIFDRVDYKLFAGGHHQFQFWLYALVVSNAEFIRCAECDCVERARRGLTADSDLMVCRSERTDQRSKIRTFNIAPTWTQLINAETVFTLGGFVRQDQYNYYPSGNPFADLDARSAAADGGTEPDG